MWAATVRRCPPGHVRHPSQFGARLQLARALTHAPYLICDGNYSYPASTQPQADINGDLPEITRNGISNPIENHKTCRHHPHDPCFSACHGRCPQDFVNQEIPQCFDPNLFHSNGQFPCSMNRLAQSISSEDEVRVQLPYSRRELDPEEDYSIGNRIVRRYDDVQSSQTESEDDNVVGLSYQQRSIHGTVPYNEVWGTDSLVDCWGESPLLIKRGRLREFIRTLFVIGLSFTLITFVIMGFKIYNMLITVLFLFFLISTLSLLIFLLMKRPKCFACCRESWEMSRNAENGVAGARGINRYLTEAQVEVIKKRITDSPPPYESPPDYNSLPPELIVHARGLATAEPTTSTRQAEETAVELSRTSTKTNLFRAFTVRSPSSLLSSTSPLLSNPFKSSSNTPSTHSSASVRSKPQEISRSNAPLPDPDRPPPPYEFQDEKNDINRASKA